jgi:hypothetical protein
MLIHSSIMSHMINDALVLPLSCTNKENIYLSTLNHFLL